MFNVAACPEDLFGRKLKEKVTFDRCKVLKLKTPSKKLLNK